MVVTLKLPPLPKLEQQDHLQGRRKQHENSLSAYMCVTAIAPVALPPVVVATELASAARAGAARPPVRLTTSVQTPQAQCCS